MGYITMASDREQQVMHIEVILAMPETQKILTVELTAGSTVADAIELSGIVGMFEDFELDQAKVGIFGHLAATQTELNDGDRVEIYRPLIADPKEIRRQRAREQA